jgi:hydrogenase maturation protease
LIGKRQYPVMAYILILGIGQTMRQDDGAGVEAVRRWQVMFAEHAADQDLHVMLIELPGLKLLDTLQEATHVLIVDAVQSGAKPGYLHQLRENDLAEFGQGSNTAHGWGIAETLALGRQLEPAKMPEQVDLLGIEIKSIKLGEGLSTEVAAVIDKAAVMIEKWVEEASAE